MNLEELRAEIDTIDDNLLQDFAQRMNVVGQIGLEKKSEGLRAGEAGRHRDQAAPGDGAVWLHSVVHAL